MKTVRVSMLAAHVYAALNAPARGLTYTSMGALVGYLHANDYDYCTGGKISERPKPKTAVSCS